jgi:dipeptide transport system permease protein
MAGLVPAIHAAPFPAYRNRPGNWTTWMTGTRRRRCGAYPSAVPMLIYFLRRVALTIPTFVALMFLTFVAIRLVPGDPVEVRVGEHGMSPERLAYFRHELGLDQPFWKQFLDYAWRLVHGDFGVSLATQQKVLTEFLTLFPATLELSFFAMVFAIGIGVPAGAVAAVRRGGFFDQALMTISLFGYSMPIFWWGLLLIMFVGVTLGWTPVSGRIDLIKYYFDQPTGFMVIDAALSDQPGAVVDALRHLILPAIVLGTVPLGVIARMTRSSMLEVLSEDYVRTARAKGLSPLRVIGLHALRNALLPVVTVIGLSISGLMAGAVLTETIFSWPGVGKWLIESIGRRDYPALQGGVLLVSAAVITVNLIVDLLYGAINPRIRHGR